MKKETRNTSLLSYFALFAMIFIFILQSCDDTFEPLKENDRFFFSIYGYLDASVDTNWIRLIPLREGIDILPDVNATVTLEHMESGTVAVMNDSLFQYVGGRISLNYWTTMELVPGDTYRLIAARDDGKQSSVVIEMPPDFPPPIVIENMNSAHGLDTIIIEGVQNLADVRTLWQVSETFSNRNPVYNFAHLQDTVEVINNEWIVEIQTADDYESISRLYVSGNFAPEDLFTVDHKQVWVASAGPGWLYFPEIDDNVIALPDGISNVENGTGYVIGIISKTVPLFSCFEEDEDPVACPEENPVW